MDLYKISRSSQSQLWKHSFHHGWADALRLPSDNSRHWPLYPHGHWSLTRAIIPHGQSTLPWATIALMGNHPFYGPFPSTGAHPFYGTCSLLRTILPSTGNPSSRAIIAPTSNHPLYGQSSFRAIFALTDHHRSHGQSSLMGNHRSHGQQSLTSNLRCHGQSSLIGNFSSLANFLLMGNHLVDNQPALSITGLLSSPAHSSNTLPSRDYRHQNNRYLRAFLPIFDRNLFLDTHFTRCLQRQRTHTTASNYARACRLRLYYSEQVWTVKQDGNTPSLTRFWFQRVANDVGPSGWCLAIHGNILRRDLMFCYCSQILVLSCSFSSLIASEFNP